MDEIVATYEWLKSTLDQAMEAPASMYREGYTTALKEAIEWFEYEYDLGDD